MSSPLAPTNQTGYPFGTVPTVAVTAAAGTTATATVAAGSFDQRGSVSVASAGTGQAAGAVATVTFSKPFAVPPTVNLTPLTAATAALNDFITTVTATGFQIGVAAAMTAATTYTFGYSVTP